MSFDVDALPREVLIFLTQRHLATLTTLRADGSPHVVAVGFTWDNDARLVRVITSGGSQKVSNVDHQPPGGPVGPRAAVCQVDGARWLTLEGRITVQREPVQVAEAVRRYAVRYRTPRENPTRVALAIAVDRVLGRP